MINPIFFRLAGWIVIVICVSLLTGFSLSQDPTSEEYADKHIVLIAGDEEYRSEEALPQLARILSEHHGFRCTVLLPIDPETGEVDPKTPDNIPGLEALETADLMILFTRFRALPDDQMEQIDRYLRRGGPVIGLRTATHAFSFPEESRWHHYSDGYSGEKAEWTGGFGRLVLGEKWISHHGRHKHESTRGIVAESGRGHPVTRGIEDGDIWGSTDVYTVRLPLPGDSSVLVLGQVLARRGEYDETDLDFGMRPDDGPPVAEKNDPMMPIAWTRSYRLPGGAPGRAFTSTIGSSTDLLNEGVRRLWVNAVYWALGLEEAIPEEGTKVDLVGDYRPSQYGFR